MSSRKGKTYEEIYGPEKAKEIKKKIRMAWTKERREQASKKYKEMWKNGTPPPNAYWNKGLTKETSESVRKYAEKSSKTMKKLWSGNYKYKNKIINLLRQNNIKTSTDPNIRKKISKTLLTKFTFEERQKWARKGAIASAKKGPKQNTSIELALQKGLSKQKIKFDTQVVVPDVCIIDIVPKNTKIAIFCDGDYWHNRPEVKERDKRHNKILTENGWTVLRFWETEIKHNLDDCINKILEVLHQ